MVRDGWTQIAGVPSLNSQISHQGQPLPISNIWDVLVDENTPVDPEGREGVPEEILVAPIRRRNRREGGLYVTAALEMASGPPLSATVLVDTGAEVCLVREGFLPPQTFQEAPKRIKLIAANGDVLGGG